MKNKKDIHGSLERFFLKNIISKWFIRQHKTMHNIAAQMDNITQCTVNESNNSQAAWIQGWKRLYINHHGKTLHLVQTKHITFLTRNFTKAH